jgi:hypothetical protein
VAIKSLAGVVSNAIFAHAIGDEVVVGATAVVAWGGGTCEYVRTSDDIQKLAHQRHASDLGTCRGRSCS